MRRDEKKWTAISNNATEMCIDESAYKLANNMFEKYQKFPFMGPLFKWSYKYLLRGRRGAPVPRLIRSPYNSIQCDFFINFIFLLNSLILLLFFGY